MASNPILIVGGGLGGLTTALALSRRGLSARVLEGAPEFGAIGYGIQFGPNVFHVFDRLGLMEPVLAIADAPAAVLMRDALDGKELVRIPTGASLRARFKYPYIIVHRIDLHNVLLDACRRSDAIELVSDAMVTGFEDHAVRIAVTTTDGRAFSGSALVAADGVRSFFRQNLIGDGEPRASGYAALRTIIPMSELKVDVPRDSVVLWGGPGYHVIHYPLRHGREFNIVAVFRTATHAEKADVATYRAELEHIYRDAHPSMRALNAMMDLRWRRPVADRNPVRHWHKGRIVLIGDAAHAPLQSLAQGACMAIEDGLCLGELLFAANGDFTAAFRRFEALRLARTARVQLESRAIWDSLLHPEGVARDVRNATVADWDEAHIFHCLSWLYDGCPLPTKSGSGPGHPNSL
ncbi:MAG TPA: FAD-dependent monooxygenase [Xanthobacteraceae bacterium]|jgi:2-polyprenyl-6-methoxyphenol hydroxylase-like FAD-dependent oxidoreductase|nr:FAD-dependent monooxygenase [Xanthobacteraceae bacterium]